MNVARMIAIPKRWCTPDCGYRGRHSLQKACPILQPLKLYFHHFHKIPGQFLALCCFGSSDARSSDLGAGSSAIIPYSSFHSAALWAGAVIIQACVRDMMNVPACNSMPNTMSCSCLRSRGMQQSSDRLHCDVAPAHKTVKRAHTLIQNAVG